MNLPDRSKFENAYAGHAPWDIGTPQQTFVDIADQITGSVLDAGCGTGENGLFFASRGNKVTGIDFLAEPINRAKQKAAQRHLAAVFLLMDALALKELPEVFDTVIDSGLFHVFSDEDRRCYVDALASVSSRADELLCSASATTSRAPRDRDGSHGRRSRPLSPVAGQSSPSSRPDSGS